MNNNLNRAQVASRIEQTLLNPRAAESDIVSLCKGAREEGFGVLCIAPCWLLMAKGLLEGSGVKLATTVGFPHGNSMRVANETEAAAAIQEGAAEIIVVMNTGFVRSNLEVVATADIVRVIQVCGPRALVKVIIEVPYLSEAETRKACRWAMAAGATHLQTGTGFADVPKGSATNATAIAEVAFMRRVVGPHIGITGVGHINTLGDAVEMFDAGATRVSTSHGVKIVNFLPR